MREKRNIIISVLTGAIFTLIILAVFLTGIFIGNKQKNKHFWPPWEKRHTYHSFVPKKLNSHGVFGQIESLGKDTIVVKERDGALKTIIWNDQTRFIKGRGSFSALELVVNETVVVIGEPSKDQNAIVAHIVRVLGQHESTINSPTQLQNEL